MVCPNGAASAAPFLLSGLADQILNGYTLSAVQHHVVRVFPNLRHIQDADEVMNFAIAILEDAGIKKDAYQSAVNFLIAKGYLVPKKDGSNWYSFHEQPLKPKDVSTK